MGRRFCRGSVALLVVLLVSTCGYDSPKGIQSGVSGSEIVLKSPKGYYKYKVSEIDSLTIAINGSPPSSEVPLTKTFAGGEVGKITAALGLHKPSEPGAPAALITGTILIRFHSRSIGSRTLNILNGRLLEDTSFKEAHYSPGQVIDRVWLERQ